MAKTHFIWNSVTDNVLAEVDDTGAVQATYTQVPELHGSIVSQKRDGVNSYYHFDGQGSTRQLTDSDQNVTDTATYTAFGEEVENTGATENPWGYKGSSGYHCGASDGSSYVRNRILNQSVGRWLSQDPAKYVDGTNLFRYVRNNPIRYNDPLGLKTHYEAAVELYYALEAFVLAVRYMQYLI